MYVHKDWSDTMVTDWNIKIDGRDLDEYEIVDALLESRGIKNIDKFLNPSEEDLLKYKIGAMGSLEQVLHVSTKGDMAQSHYFQGITYDDLAKQRKQVIEATKEDLVGLAPLFAEALSQDNLCVIGNANKVEANKEMFKEIKDLIK